MAGLMKRLMLYTFFCLCFASPIGPIRRFADRLTSVPLASTTAGTAPESGAVLPGTREDAATNAILPVPTGWNLFHRAQNRLKAFKDTPASMKSNHQAIQHYVSSSGHTTGSLFQAVFEKLRASESCTFWPSLAPSSESIWRSHKMAISQLTDTCIQTARFYLCFAWRTVVQRGGSWNELIAFHATDGSLLPVLFGAVLLFLRWAM